MPDSHWLRILDSGWRRVRCVKHWACHVRRFVDVSYGSPSRLPASESLVIHACVYIFKEGSS